jgi:Na+-driven multidrug efflux pump
MKKTLNSTAIQIIVRVTAAYLIASYFGIKGFALACLIGWLFMLGYQVPVLLKISKKNRMKPY